MFLVPPVHRQQDNLIVTTQVLICYPYLYPAYKAGGPTRSLHNLAQAWSVPDMQLSFVGLNRDIDGTALEVTADEWQYSQATDVRAIYLAPQKLSAKISDLLANADDDSIIYTNGIYSPAFNLLPLRFHRSKNIILAPRGMLHPEALAQKSIKKKLFISMLKALGLKNRVVFHATHPDEAEHIRNIFGSSCIVHTIPNIPDIQPHLPMPPKKQGYLSMVSIALISPMKNHLFIIRALKYVTASVTYDIYGPIKEHAYWNECLATIAQLPPNIRVVYHGELPPASVKDKLASAHIAVLPSKSENFGHAHFEALSAGRPLISSTNIPWQGLRNAFAGFNIDVADTNVTKELAVSIDFFAQMNNDELSRWSSGAASYARTSVNTNSIIREYINLFKNPTRPSNNIN